MRRIFREEFNATRDRARNADHDEPKGAQAMEISLEQAVHPKNRGLMSVYVLCADEHSVKIGISNHPGNRATAIQVGQDREIRVYWAIRLWKPLAREIERIIHTRLKNSLSHIRGEWYLFSPAQAVAEIKTEIARQGFPSSPCTLYGWEERA
jgi:hypothetical protein